MKEHSFYWLEQFKLHPEFGKYRFKRLDKGFKGYPTFDFDEILLDIVDLETFIKIEKNRIQLFIGTQFGLYPWFYDFPEFYSEEKIIEVLSKSLLSGHVAGLGIYSWRANAKHGDIQNKLIIYFKNEIAPR